MNIFIAFLLWWTIISSVIVFWYIRSTLKNNKRGFCKEMSHGTFAFICLLYGPAGLLVLIAHLSACIIRYTDRIWREKQLLIAGGND